jgi:arylformamidase
VQSSRAAPVRSRRSVGHVEIFDISVPVGPRTVTYPGDPTVHLSLVQSLAEGAVANVSKLELSVHTGTHVDAPVHFVDGAAGVDVLPLEPLVGPALVIDATATHGRMDAGALANVELAERVIFKTTNSQLWERETFVDDFVALTEDAAQLLIEAGVRLVGIDYLSIGDEDVHRALLRAGVVILEGLDMREVEPGHWELICGPLKLVGSDGAPARVFLTR